MFPEARFICLYRHCMDVIVSILDASPYGLVSFGVEPYVSRQPYNYVLALAEYWLAKAELGLLLEKTYPERCIRVRYEDLVTNAQEEMRCIYRFLGVESGVPDLDFGRVNSQYRWSDGPGDHKIGFTTEVEMGSIGRGRVIPAALIHENLLERINSAMISLEYEPIGAAWNHEPMPCLKDPVPARILREHLLPTLRRGSATQRSGNTTEAVCVALEDVGVTLVVTPRLEDVTTIEGYIGADLVARVNPVLQMALGQLNFGDALRKGLVRKVGAIDPGEESPWKAFETFFDRIRP